jgi:ATP-binding cassette subfamily C protein
VQLLPSFDAIAALEEELHRVQEDIVPSDEMIPLRESVRLEHVGFSHSTPDQSTLDDVTLELRQGAITAIVGPSGAGKSTIADILTGLLRPQEGRVSIDGRTLEDSMIAAWKRQLGYVSQDTFVFHDTVRANLSWANPEATEHDIAEALQAARAEFVFDLETTSRPFVRGPFIGWGTSASSARRPPDAATARDGRGDGRARSREQTAFSAVARLAGT